MSDRKTVLVEQTSKRYKAIQLAGGLLFLVAFAIELCIGAAVMNGSEKWKVGTAVACLIGAAGIIVLGYGRFMAWWHHG
jgi:hypothetical protein